MIFEGGHGTNEYDMKDPGFSWVPLAGLIVLIIIFLAFKYG